MNAAKSAADAGKALLKFTVFVSGDADWDRPILEYLKDRSALATVILPQRRSQRRTSAWTRLAYLWSDLFLPVFRWNYDDLADVRVLRENVPVAAGASDCALWLRDGEPPQEFVRAFHGGVLTAFIGACAFSAASDQIGFCEHQSHENSVDVGLVRRTSDEVTAYQRDLPIERFDTNESIVLKARPLIVSALEDVLSGQPGSPLSAVPSSSPEADRNAAAYWRDVRAQRRRAERSPLLGRRYAQILPLIQWVRLIAFVVALPFVSLYRRYLESRGRAPIVIFYYHGIGNSSENWMTLPLEEFDSQLRYMRRHFEIISFSEAVERLRSGNNRKSAVVITFDDGYANTYRHGIPYMRTERVPAVFFICVGAMLNGELLPHDVKKGYASALMSLENIRDLARDFEIGSHGNYHERVDELRDQALRTAIVGSGDVLQSRIDAPVKFFAFPQGRYTSAATQVAAERYVAACAGHGGYNLPGSSCFLLHRIANPQSIVSLLPALNGLHRAVPFGQKRLDEYRP